MGNGFITKGEQSMSQITAKELKGIADKQTDKFYKETLNSATMKSILQKAKEDASKGLYSTKINLPKMSHATIKSLFKCLDDLGFTVEYDWGNFDLSVFWE